jgi:DNA polymerase-1
MIDKGQVKIVQHPRELPEPGRVKRLYMDHETNSFDRKRPGDNPWGGDRTCGTAATWDDCPVAYYVPVRHEHAWWNIDLEAYQRWHRDLVENCEVWSNQNVRFDAHFSAEDGAVFRGELFDTLNNAKLINSDRGFGGGGYGLDALSSDWLDDDDTSHDQAVQAYLAGAKTKNYADVPADVLGEYAGYDVLKARRLEKYELKKRDEIAAKVKRFPLIWDVEQKLTPVLWDMEQAGVRVDPQELKVKEMVTTYEIIQLQEALHKLTGYPIEPHNTNDCYELIVNRWGLPILGWNDHGEDRDPTPSFDKEALASYINHPDVAASEMMSKAFRLMLYCRKRHTLKSLFLEPFQRYQRDGFMHPQHTQIIRTGRMSCKRPNNQQNSDEAKQLIHPDDDGSAFLSNDASQIEFRLLMHYSEDAEPLEAYARDPDTDFHTWVAGMCQIPRRPAKNVNFCIGYGGGKAKVLSMLAADMTLVGSLGDVVDKLIAEGRLQPEQRRTAFQMLCSERATQVYRQYHDRLPGLKRVTRRAALTCKSTGYVFNEMGRVRHMPERAAWRALNSLTQGLASDIIKNGMVKLSPRYCSWTRERGISLRINNHDQLVWHGEKELMRSPEVVSRIVRELEEVPVPLRVPIRFGAGWSDKNWSDADADGNKLEVRRDNGNVTDQRCEVVQAAG